MTSEQKALGCHLSRVGGLSVRVVNAIECKKLVNCYTTHAQEVASGQWSASGHFTRCIGKHLDRVGGFR